MSRSGGAAVLVFAGPTLAPAGELGPVSLPAGCALRPPARRGDILAALAEQPAVLVLLDGYYYTVPAVTHKEILYALDAGVQVIGAASLGALRAAELAPCGMTGVGWVFAGYRDGSLDGDDEVALLHAPADLGYRPLTVALAEVRHALPRIAGAEDLIGELKGLPFTERSPERVAGLARRCLGEAAAEALSASLARTSVKRNDAREAIALALSLPRSPTSSARARPAGRYLTFAKEESLRGPGEVALMDAWRAAQILHPQAARFVRRLRLRLLLSAAALRGNLRIDPGQEHERAVALQRSHVESFGRPLLPFPEYREEARCALLAAAALSLPGGARGALRSLAGDFGLPQRGSLGRLLRLFPEQPDLLPGWWAARAFSLTPACAPAFTAAAAAHEVHACFLRWSNGARVVREDLWRLASGLWGCSLEDVPAEAARRGLDRLRDALEKLAAAERLPEPINAYREKAWLLACSSLRLERLRGDP